MGKRYRQLSLDERKRLLILKAEGRGPSEIGRLLGRDRKTIERELVRNAPPVHQGYYLPHKAHERAKGRKQEAGQREWLKSSELQRHVEELLKEGCSPELIAGRLKQEQRHPRGHRPLRHHLGTFFPSQPRDIIVELSADR